MEVRFAHLADAVNVSQEGKVNVTGIFDRLQTDIFPIIWPVIVIVIKIEGDVAETDKEHEITIKIVDEDGKPMVELKRAFRLSKSTSTLMPPAHGEILRIQNLEFVKAGTYSFDIFINGRYHDALPLYVVQK